ncbi:MAG: hypothetical protein ACRD82_20325, partial [Blastocatellia bacterium]
RTSGCDETIRCNERHKLGASQCSIRFCQSEPWPGVFSEDTLEESFAGLIGEFGDNAFISTLRELRIGE